MWLFREQLRLAKIFERLLLQVHCALGAAGVKLNSGQTVDGNIVTARKQLNTREESDETVKDGAMPVECTKNPEKLRQKDIDVH